MTKILYKNKMPAHERSKQYLRTYTKRKTNNERNEVKNQMKKCIRF